MAQWQSLLLEEGICSLIRMFFHLWPPALPLFIHLCFQERCIKSKTYSTQHPIFLQFATISAWTPWPGISSTVESMGGQGGSPTQQVLQTCFYCTDDQVFDSSRMIKIFKSLADISAKAEGKWWVNKAKTCLPFSNSFSLFIIPVFVIFPSKVVCFIQRHCCTKPC